MPKKPRQFVNGEIYHIVLRRMGNELLFGDINDYYRGIFYIYECNTSKPITIRERRRIRTQFKKAVKKIEINRGQTSGKIIWKDSRDLLVEVLVFCLMPNHIHLLLRQLKRRGISKFIQKIASGCAAYFKSKYGIKLRGHFFQDRFNAVHVKTDKQLRVIFTYIHTNPTELIEPGWRVKGIKNPKKVIKFLEEYKWHSYPDYLGKYNFPSVTERKFLLTLMGGEKGCREWVEGWIKHKKKIKKLVEKFASLSLEK